MGKSYVVPYTIRIHRIGIIPCCNFCCGTFLHFQSQFNAEMQAGQYADKPSVVGLDGAVIVVEVTVVIYFGADTYTDIWVYDEFIFPDLPAQEELEAINVFIGGFLVFDIVEGYIFIWVKYFPEEEDGLKVGTLGAEQGFIFLGEEIPAEGGFEPEASAVYKLFCTDIRFFLSEIYFFSQDIIRVVGIYSADGQFQA